jgi:Flp pilus assembly protein TadG
MAVILIFVSFAVDYGRAQVAKTELQRACDAAARYGAAGLSSGVTAVQNRVVAAAADNKVDGTSLVIDTTSDLEFGTWDPSTDTFTVLTGADRTSADAIRVTARRTASRGTGVSTLFAASMGRQTIDIKAIAIATKGKITSQSLNADACPWLAGMPTGSTVAATGGNPTSSTAPSQSPYQVSGVTISGGVHLSFRDAGGATSYSGSGTFGPDGQTSWIVAQAATNGINTTSAPIQSVVGIFLDNNAPNTTALAGSLDFSTDASRDFTTLSPGLKQVFFIGDGLNSSGQLQEFVVPTGATRLYLGIMDEKGWWWDNAGTISTTLMDSKVQLVK